MPLIENTVLENRYRIEGLLSQGGMGAIYRAFDTNLKTLVAIKENFFQTAHSIQQFEQEALILARLRHPGLPRVIHHFGFQQKQYLVMDFIEGENLWEIVQKQGRPLEERQALAYLLQVCDAVSYLHRQSPPIIHRDIKPQNIKITPDDQAVLVDFGIAKVAEIDSRTHTGAQAFTPGFSPPEQYSGAGTTPRSDVYALGATLYAVLVGKKPPDSISRMVGNANYQPPHLLNPTLSQAVSAAIEHAMQVQPTHRPASVELWRKELESVLAETAISPPSITKETLEEPTLRSTAPREAVITGGETQPITSLPLPAKPPGSSRWLWLGSGGILLLLSLGFLIFWTATPGLFSETVNTEATVAAALTAAAAPAVTGAERPARIDTEATVGAVLTAAAQQEAAEAATRQARETPAATQTPLSPTTTPTAIPPLPTATSTLTPTPDLPSITVETGANLRSGPGTSYNQVGQLAAGSTVEIIGRNEDSSWWQISHPGGPDGLAWLAADLGTATNVAAVALAPIPPTPPLAIPTPVAEPVIKILTSEQFKLFRESSCPISGEAVIDPSDDANSAYTDITQVISSLSGEILTVSFVLRELPKTLTFNRLGVGRGDIEYLWSVNIDVDANPETGQINGWEYSLEAKAIVGNPNTPPYELPIALGAEPAVWQCDSNGLCFAFEDAAMTVESELHRLTLTGHIPGITQASRLNFMTRDYLAGYDIAVCPAN